MSSLTRTISRNRTYQQWENAKRFELQLSADVWKLAKEQQRKARTTDMPLDLKPYGGFQGYCKYLAAMWKKNRKAKNVQ